MMFGIQLLPVLGELNAAFGGKNPFSPGEDFGPALLSVMNPAHEELNGVLHAYIAMMPRGFQESLRAIIHYALSSEPRVLLNFSWAPAYDFEITVRTQYLPEQSHPERTQHVFTYTITIKNTGTVAAQLISLMMRS